MKLEGYLIFIWYVTFDININQAYTPTSDSAEVQGIFYSQQNLAVSTCKNYVKVVMCSINANIGTGSDLNIGFDGLGVRNERGNPCTEEKELTIRNTWFKHWWRNM